MKPLPFTAQSRPARSQSLSASGPRLLCRLCSAGSRRTAVWALASLLAVACAVMIAACGGDAGSAQDDLSKGTATSAGHEVSHRASTGDPDWAPGEVPIASAATMSPIAAAAAAAAASLRKPTRELWNADGRARTTLPEDRPHDSALHWSGQRYATHAQLAHEELTNAHLTFVVDADNEAAVETAMALGEQLAVYGSDKSLLGVFVRSRQPALAARLAERLTLEQGWANVFVVF